MTVSSTINRITYNCEPPQKEFPFNFKILAEENLLIVLKDENDTETILVLNTDYSVNTGPWPNGGTVTTLAEDPYESGNTLTIIRQLPFTQGADYIEGDSFPAETHEEGLDRVVMLLQGLAERLLKLKTGSSYSDLTVPNPIAGRYLRWKEDLSGLENCAYFLNDINISDYIKTLLDDETAIAARNTLNLRHDNLPDVSPDDHHVRYTDGEAETVAAGLIATHALLPSIHHLRYTDAEVVSAIEAAGFTLVSAKVISSADEDITFNFGRASVFGSGDQAFFSHRDKTASTEYAFKQDAVGHTYVNAGTGKTVKIRINNGNIQEVSILGTFLNTLSAGVADYDKFVVADPGATNLLKYRTGAEVLSDIGGAASAHLHDTQTLNCDGITSDGGTFYFTTSAAIKIAQTLEMNCVNPQLYMFQATNEWSQILRNGTTKHLDITHRVVAGVQGIITITDDGYIILNPTTAVQIPTCSNAGVDTDKFLVLDPTNNVDFRTGTEVLSDIGVEEGATADQTGDEIVALLEALIGLAKLSHTGGLSDVGANDHHNENHGLGGGTHAVTTLAGINAKITDADMDDHADARPPTAHTLASHSTKAHAELTNITANQHHAETHTLASHTTKPHSALTDVTIDQHHARDHAAAHGPAAADPLKLDDLAAPDDNVDLNASIAKHGLLKKLDNIATNFMNGQGNWAAAGGAGIPSGVILLWSGAVGDIPAGWVLCNGANSTPDLRDKFIVGAGSAYAVGATGGASTMAHTHGIPSLNSAEGGFIAGGGVGKVGRKYGTTDICYGAGDQIYPLKSYTVAGTSQGASNTENRPPYYALCYIMKT